MNDTYEASYADRIPIMNSDVQAVVELNHEDSVTQPDEFRCCPLGVQFYSPTPLPTFGEVQVRLLLDGRESGDEVSCAGMVVHCQLMDEPRMHRVWVYFLDLEEEAREHMRCFAHESQCLCPFCQNF